MALRERAEITAAERAELDRRLDGFDERSPRGPWTRQTLRTIAERPAVRAPDLAAAAGVETKRYKTDVRKLKELGLTESLEVGYRLSPRGRAYLRRPAGGGRNRTSIVGTKTRCLAVRRPPTVSAPQDTA